MPWNAKGLAYPALPLEPESATCPFELPPSRLRCRQCSECTAIRPVEDDGAERGGAVHHHQREAPPRRVRPERAAKGVLHM